MIYRQLLIILTLFVGIFPLHAMETFEDYIQKIASYNANLVVGELERIAKNIESWKTLPAYADFQKLDLSKIITLLSKSALYTQTKWPREWQPRYMLAPAILKSNECHGCRWVVQPIKEMSVFREIQMALAPHNESVTYVEKQEPLNFSCIENDDKSIKNRITYNKLLSYASSWDQPFDKRMHQITEEEKQSIEQQLTFIKYLREREEYLKQNTQKKKEQALIIPQKISTPVPEDHDLENQKVEEKIKTVHIPPLSSIAATVTPNKEIKEKKTQFNVSSFSRRILFLGITICGTLIALCYNERFQNMTYPLLTEFVTLLKSMLHERIFTI